MRFFSKLKEKTNLALVFDISSSSVGAALFVTRKENGPQIVFSVREPIKLEQNIDFDKFLSSTMNSLEIVVNKISKSGVGAPSSFFCILSSPWYSSQIRNISFKKNTPFIFTSKIADELINKEISIFEEENLKNKEKIENVSTIELKNMRTMLNGYIVNSPLNKKTKEIDMALFISVSPTSVLTSIENIIDKHFHQKNVKFSSFTLASFTVARDMFIHQDNFTIVDIGGETTELSLVKKDALYSSASFPIGYNFFIRELSLALKCSTEEARSYLSIYKDNHASDELESKLRPIIEKLKLDWLNKFQESLVFLSNDISVSSNIFMTTDEELSAFFAQTIKNEQFNQYAFTESKFRVVYLGTQMLHGIAEYKKDVKHDSFIIIESIYINNFLV
jgi:cell division ATPase FtsA